MITRREAAAAVSLAAVVFLASFAMARPSPKRELASALRLVQEDRAHTVCLSAGPCVWPDARSTVFVFLAAGDCAGSLYDTAVLEELFRATPRERLNVVGVVRGMSAADARAFAVASGITYPLYLDAPRIGRFVHDPRPPRGNRPMKVLVDRDGVVRQVWRSGAEVRTLRRDLQRLGARVGA